MARTVNKRLPVDLSERDRARLMAIREHEGSASLASALRFLILWYATRNGIVVRETVPSDEQDRYQVLPNGWYWKYSPLEDVSRDIS